jgi:3,4-dihydroxy 2-butanone 4-phosphate synthase/GTP cyclohydrolase II
MHDAFSQIDDALCALAEGRTIIVVDDEDRENEGDFVAAAERVTPETVEFLITHGRGLVCAPIMPDQASRLDLHPVVEANTAPHRTAFYTQVDHKSCQTGVTAAERALTIRALADSATRPSDLVRPGHVFPLVAKEGGVLRRAGHTEATVDLCRLAGLTPAGVLCEILEGTGRASRERLQAMATEFHLPIVSIEALIRYRRLRERLVHRAAEAELPTRYGKGRVIGYHVDYEPGNNPIAFVMGNLGSAEAPLIRIHSSCFTGDLLDSLRCDCGDQLHLALEMIGREGVGALIYLPQEGRGIGLIEKIKAYNLQDKGLDTVEANLALGFRADLRDYGVGLQILKDLGLSRVRLLTNNPKKTDAFVYDGYDLHVVGQVPIIAPEHSERQRYLDAKRDKLGHKLPPRGDGPSRPASVNSLGWLVAAVIGFGLCGPIRGARAEDVDPKARQVLDEVVAAYRKLPAYEDHGAVTVWMTVNGKPQARTVAVPIAYVRPGQIAFSAEGARLVVDGAQLAVTIQPTRRYLTRPAPKEITLDTVTEGPLGASLLGSAGGRPVYMVLNLLLSPDPTRYLLEGGAGLRLAGDAKVGDTMAQTLVVDPDQGPGYLLRIDPATHLVIEIEQVVDPKSLEGLGPPGTRLVDARIAWTSGAITSEPPKPGRFAFEPPAGFAKVGPLEPKKAEDAEKEPRGPARKP